jgi:hypothetical protein
MIFVCKTGTYHSIPEQASTVRYYQYCIYQYQVLTRYGVLIITAKKIKKL